MKLFEDKGFVKGYNKSVSQDFTNMNFLWNSLDKRAKLLNEKLSRLNLDLHENYELHFNYPAHITNAIISIDKKTINELYLYKLTDSLAFIHTTHLVVLVNELNHLDEIKILIDSLDSIPIESIIFCFNYSEILHSDEFAALYETTRFMFKTLVFDSPFDKNYADQFFFFKRSFLITYNKKITEFDSNLTLFSESQLYHTYFNRKLYIDSSGDIKNAPETTEVFGNINELNSGKDIKEIVLSKDFQKYWNVHKGIIDVCRDCEFRHMCVDNRIPFQRKQNEWYHQSECNYNPYLGKWTGEPEYKTLKECGVKSDKEGFCINHDKIAELNNGLSYE